MINIYFCLFRFVNYGSGPKRFPLQDVLQYALEFAESSPPADTSLNCEATPLCSPPSTEECKVEGGSMTPPLATTPSASASSSLSEVEMESPQSQTR